jgi:phosphohistidine phosphatase
MYWNGGIMKLYLVQHGEAVSEEVDPDKPLSPEGKDNIIKMADFLRELNIRPAEIWHSTKTRAKQTADIMLNKLKPVAGLKQREGLAPNDHPEKILEELRAERENLMIVSHLPFLQKLASLLVFGSSDKSIIGFKKGSVVCLERKDNDWEICFFLTPDLLGSFNL